jgi:hypothetical protein
MKKVMMLVLVLAALGMAVAEKPVSVSDYQPTLTVVLNAPLFTTVTLEQPFYELLGAEFMYGVRFATDYKESYAVAPFIGVANYSGVSSWWMEFTLPTGILNYVGLSETWFSFGYQYRW